MVLNVNHMNDVEIEVPEEYVGPVIESLGNRGRKQLKTDNIEHASFIQVLYNSRSLPLNL